MSAQMTYYTSQLQPYTIMLKKTTLYALLHPIPTPQCAEAENNLSETMGDAKRHIRPCLLNFGMGRYWQSW